MKTVLKKRWEKCGHFRVRIMVRADEARPIRRVWFRHIIVSSSRKDRPESPTDS